MTLPIPIAAKPNIPIQHQRIHEGNHFFVHKIALNINIANPKYFLLIPPPYNDSNTVKMDFIFEIVTDIGGTVYLFEDASVSANGTELYITNNNRWSSTTSGVYMYEDPTVTDEGLCIFEERKGTTTSGDEIGEFDRDDEEIIPHYNKKYIFKFIPLANGANITFEVNWYDDRPSSPTPI